MKKELTDHEKAVTYTRALDAMRIFLEECHVTVVQHDTGTIVDHGSGICLQVANKRLIVTAAHVVKDCVQENISLVWSPTPDNRRIRFPRVEMMGGGEDDKIDIAILELDNSASFVSKKFIAPSFFEGAPKNLEGQLIAAHGCPGDWRQKELANLYSITPLTRDLKPLDPALWTQDAIQETEIEFDCPDTVFRPFDDRPTRLPSMAGMSGGTVWACNLAGSLIWTPESARIVGIITNRDDRNERLRVMRADHVHSVLQLYYDL